MPELPEVETTKNGITPHILEKHVTGVVVRQPKLRWPVPQNLPEELANKRVTDIQRRAKYLLLEFTDNHSRGWLMIHLGMSGNLRVVAPSATVMKHDHVDILFDENTVLRYQDPRRFGCVIWLGEHPHEHKLLANLGPEPLSDDFNTDYLNTKAKNKRVAVKLFVMKQETVTGIGNIYANEALFTAGIHPQEQAGNVSREQWQRFVTAAKRILRQAITQGGTTLKDFVGGDGKPGYFQQELRVYGRANEPCVHCGEKLKEVRLNNRSSVFCEHCQPLSQTDNRPAT